MIFDQRRPFLNRLLLFISIVLCSASAKSAAPNVSHLFPAGGQRGTNVEVMCFGEFDWPPRIATEGITATHEMETGRLSIAIPAELPADRAWIRLYSQDGASRAVPFLIGNLDEVAEQEPNNTLESAQKINRTEATINGVLQEQNDVDGYSLDLGVGQTLVASIAAHSQLGSPMDAILQVVSPRGTVLAENHDCFGLDPTVVYTATQPGSHYVRVFAFPSEPGTKIRYSGDANYVYRLTLTTGPYITHTAPMSVPLDDPGSVEVLGWNIPPRTKLPVRRFGGNSFEGQAVSELSTDQRLPPNTRLGFVYSPEMAGSARVSMLPHGVTRSAVGMTNRDALIAFPNAISGCISEPGERDDYHVFLRNGQEVVFSVASQIYHLELVPQVTLTDPDGKVAAQSRQSGPAQDALLTHEAMADGAYRLSISDRFDGGGPRYRYQLSVREAQPNFEIGLESDSIVVSADQPTIVPVTISRHNTKRQSIGDIAIEVTGLPEEVTANRIVSKPEGDNAESATISLSSKGDPYSGAIQFRATTTQPSTIRRFARAPAMLGRHTESIWLTALAKAEPDQQDETSSDDQVTQLVTAPTNTIQHSFLGVGSERKVEIVDENQDVKWQLDIPASDGWILPNGNVLLALYRTPDFPGGGVIEVDRDTKDIVFRYQGQQDETSTVQLLPDGNLVVAELGPNPRAVVVNRASEVTRVTPLQCQTDNIHMQTRMLRVLANGNYLVPHLFDFAVNEYEPNGDLVRVIGTDDRGREKRDWPFTAIRLADGNTLIACTNGNRVIEVDADGRIVWSVSNDDLDESLFNDACGAQRLSNGNTVISSYHAKDDEVKLFEVTRDKRIVWRYAGGVHGFHHFQILTTNGRPELSAFR